MQKPPLLPVEALNRVLRVARANGMSVVLVAGFLALVSAASRDFVGALAGLIVAGAGAIEVHGSTLLVHGDRRGMGWLINSQLLCLGGILVYCIVRLKVPYMPPLPGGLQDMVAKAAQQQGVSLDQFLHDSYVSGIVLVAAGSTLYQGGMAIYYARRKRAVLRALETE